MKKNIADMAKAITVLTLAVTALILFFNINDNSGELMMAGSVVSGCLAYMLASKWYQDENDDKAGITKSIEDEMH